MCLLSDVCWCCAGNGVQGGARRGALRRLENHRPGNRENKRQHGVDEAQPQHHYRVAAGQGLHCPLEKHVISITVTIDRE